MRRKQLRLAPGQGYSAINLSDTVQDFLLCQRVHALAMPFVKKNFN